MNPATTFERRVAVVSLSPALHLCLPFGMLLSLDSLTAQR